MADTFKNVAHRTNPADDHFAVTPSDTVDFPIVPRAIYCQADGTAQMVSRTGVVLPYTMTQGQILPVRPIRINATSTTGTFYGIY